MDEKRTNPKGLENAPNIFFELITEPLILKSKCKIIRELFPKTEV
jgi:hypothetical protein